MDHLDGSPRKLNTRSILPDFGKRDNSSAERPPRVPGFPGLSQRAGELGNKLFQRAVSDPRKTRCRKSQIRLGLPRARGLFAQLV
jgi:hypothetical protein